MNKFVFKPGPPKQAKEINLNGLRQLVKNGDKITGAKNVGGTTYKVFMNGEWNYYINGSNAVLDLLRQHGANV